jgi:hypothetical protein
VKWEQKETEKMMIVSEIVMWREVMHDCSKHARMNAKGEDGVSQGA